jgi:hypothetical protein
MNRLWIFLLCSIPIFSPAQQPQAAPPARDTDVMVIAVSRDDAVLTGGIGNGRLAEPGRVGVEPLTWLTSSGEWKAIRCDFDHPRECRKFESEYLKKPHTYTVVSANGRGAAIRVKQMHLSLEDADECFGYGGKGTYSGALIAGASVAAESEDLFASSEPARGLPAHQAEAVRKAFALAVGNKLDSMKALRVHPLQLEGRKMFAMQRTYQDVHVSSSSNHAQGEPPYLVFALGSMENGRFHLLFWKENTEDENEQILGTIHMKSGMDFLVNGVSDPETQFFRVYGIRGGKVALIFSGGGGGC